MLVLSRRNGQTVEIGEAGQVLTGPIVVSVVEIRGGKVRMGIEADRGVSVRRGELREDEKRSA